MISALRSCSPFGRRLVLRVKARGNGSAAAEDGFCAWWTPGLGPGTKNLEREKGIRWMPWHQEAMKDVARCDKLR